MDQSESPGTTTIGGVPRDHIVLVGGELCDLAHFLSSPIQHALVDDTAQEQDAAECTGSALFSTLGSCRESTAFRYNPKVSILWRRPTDQSGDSRENIAKILLQRKGEGQTAKEMFRAGYSCHQTTGQAAATQ